MKQLSLSELQQVSGGSTDASSVVENQTYAVGTMLITIHPQGDATISVVDETNTFIECKISKETVDQLIAYQV
ncbi:MAG: hypothetical protein BGO43_08940 [Gammaproteobacteria bacterium 39-13]|nr:bacteriocin [Gammaproteobacteria bacterium]OJV94366.1 MAG: hypothetical protein BGO43_08940 [Gammaproteobacteria bacterium 39-13]